MESISDYIRENFDDDLVIIPWNLHTSITIRDIVFISLHVDKFRLDDLYNELIHDDDRRSYEQDYFSINSHFENYENVCLLYLVLNQSYHSNIYAVVKDDDESELFSSKFLEECLDYVIEHDFENNPIGEILAKLGFSSKIYNDGQEFSDNYLGKSGPKSARTVV